MKMNILKAVVLCTMALSLLFVGVTAVDAVDTGVAVCHDGPTNGTVVR